jgi:hypothetical protein
VSELDPLRPRPEEVAQLTVAFDPAVLEPLRPTAAEVTRLRARVRAPARQKMPMAGVAALAVAAIVLVVLGLSAPQAPLPIEVALTLAAEPSAIGPSIETWGDARVVAHPRSDGAVVEMGRGTAWFEVDPRGEARALDVVAGDVTVTVTGTRFQVVYEDAVTVRVERGSVRVRHPGGVEVVKAGGSWTNARPAPEPVVEVTPPAAPAPLAAPAGKAPRIAVIETPRPSPKKPAALAAPEPPAEPDAAAAEAREFAALLDAADRGEPDVVAKIEAWLSAHPTGPLAAEAEVLRLEALARTSPAQAERAASAWLSANPRGARRGDVLWLHATVARDGLQDCALALPSYRELADTGPRKADASALQGLCASSLGRPAEARQALEKAVALGVDDALAAPVAEALEALR